MKDCFLFFVLQDKCLSEPKNHCSTARQQAGQAVRHEWGSSSSPPTEQQTGTLHIERKKRLYYSIMSLLASCCSDSLTLFLHQRVQFSCFLLLFSLLFVLNLELPKKKFNTVTLTFCSEILHIIHFNCVLKGQIWSVFYLN